MLVSFTVPERDTGADEAGVLGTERFSQAPRRETVLLGVVDVAESEGEMGLEVWEPGRKRDGG